MNIGMTSLVQNLKLSTSQATRVSLLAGMLLYTRHVSYEKGFDGWIEVLLASYVSQSSDQLDFKADLISLENFIDENLISEGSLDLKSCICEDIQMTLRSMGESEESRIHSAHLRQVA